MGIQNKTGNIFEGFDMNSANEVFLSQSMIRLKTESSFEGKWLLGEKI